MNISDILSGSPRPADGSPKAPDAPPSGRPVNPRPSTAKVGRSEEVAYILDRRYFVLCAILVALMVSYLAKRTWPGAVDIWEHAAAARELGANPFDPGHPLYAVDRPHQYFSPYLLVVGLMSRLTGLNVIDTLNVWGVANLILLLVGLRLFVNKLVAHRHVDFYALIFILVLWGPGAWFFSGFVHFDIIAFVLTYPSTFVKGLLFLSLWAHLNYLETDDRRWLLPTLAISFVVILTHPVDQVFLVVGLAALTFTRGGDRPARRLALTGAVVAAAFGAALVWPYMSLWHMVFGAGAESYRAAFRAADDDLFVNVVARSGLALLILPFAARRLPNWRRDPLVLMFAGTLGLYLYGFVVDDSTFGRLISSAQIVGAILLAEERARVGEEAVALGPPGLGLLRWVQITTAAVVVAGLFFLRNGFVVLPERLIAGVPYGWVHSYVDNVKIRDFDFLADNHRTYPVVMSDVYTSLELPAFGSKVVSAARAQAFVDGTERANDLARAYDPSASEATRRAVLDKYDVSLVVVPVKELTQEPDRHQPLLDMGRVVSRNDRFVFVDVRRPPAEPPA